MGTNGRRAVVYCRISQDRPNAAGEGEAAGVDRQRKDCLALAEMKGLALVAEAFVDNNVSAYSGKPRPQFQRMMRLIRDDGVQAIVVWHMDRLYRSTKELDELIDLSEERGISILSVTGDSMDLTTSDGQMVARILAAVAKKSSDDTRRRVKSAKAEARAKGRWLGGGRRPYGYDLVAGDTSSGTPRDVRLVVNRDEARVVKEMARRVIAGESLHRVATDLNERGVTTAEGARWRPAHVKRTVTKPLVAGYLSETLPDGTVRRGEKGQWPPILTLQEHERARAVLANDPARKGRPPGPRKYVLTGLVYCAECGAKMAGSGGKAGKAGGGHYYELYRCLSQSGGCGRAMVGAWRLEEHLIRRMAADLRKFVAVGMGPEPAEVDESVLAEIAEIEDRQRALEEDLGVDDRVYVARARAYEAKLAELRSRLSVPRAPARAATPEEWARLQARLYEKWKNRELKEAEVLALHDAVAGIVREVRVASGRGEDLDTRVEIRYVREA